MKSQFFLGILFMTTFLGCLDNDNVPESGCYPFVYSSTSGSSTFTEVYEYNQQNRLVTISGDQLNLTLLYDAKSNLTKITYSDGRVAAYVYDPNNRMVLNTLTSNTNVLTSKTEYTYNPTGQLIKRQLYSLVGGVLTKGSYVTYEYVSTKIKNYSKALVYSSSDVLQSNTTYLYDIKQNPDNILTPSFPTVTSNNITQRIFSPVTGIAVTYTYNYTYSVKGYPKQVTITGSNGSRQTLSYEYNNCLK
jgi:YD repeat-containing protein